MTPEEIVELHRKIEEFYGNDVVLVSEEHYYDIVADSYKLQRLMDYHVDTLWDGYEGAMNDEQGDPG